MAIEQMPEQSFGDRAVVQEIPPIEDLLVRIEQDVTYVGGRNAHDTVGKELWAMRRETAQEVRMYQASLDRIDDANEQGIDPTFRDLMERKLEGSKTLLYLSYGY